MTTITVSVDSEQEQWHEALALNSALASEVRFWRAYASGQTKSESGVLRWLYAHLDRNNAHAYWFRNWSENGHGGPVTPVELRRLSAFVFVARYKTELEALKHERGRGETARESYAELLRNTRIHQRENRENAALYDKIAAEKRFLWALALRDKPRAIERRLRGLAFEHPTFAYWHKNALANRSALPYVPTAKVRRMSHGLYEAVSDLEQAWDLTPKTAYRRLMHRVRFLRNADHYRYAERYGQKV